MVGSLDDQGVKGMLKEEIEIEEKLDELFASVFTSEDTWLEYAVAEGWQWCSAKGSDSLPGSLEPSPLEEKSLFRKVAAKRIRGPQKQQAGQIIKLAVYTLYRGCHLHFQHQEIKEDRNVRIETKKLYGVYTFPLPIGFH